MNVSVTKGFFILPREVRHIIYDLMIHGAVERGPCTHLQYVLLDDSRQRFGALRLVCKEWEDYFLPFFYGGISLGGITVDHFKKFEREFELGGRFVDTVAIIVPHFSSSQVNDLKDAEAIITNCLQQCQRPRRLICVGRPPMFSKRSWLKTVAPHLCSTLTHIRLSMPLVQLATSVSRILLDASASVQHLQLEATVDDISNIPRLHLPSLLPNLSTLIFRGTKIPPQYVAKLCKRSAASSALRSLSFMECDDVMPLLYELLASHGIGAKLTVLHIDPTSDLFIGWPQPQVVLMACRSLVCFTWTAPITLANLDLLPVTLECLRLRLPTVENYFPNFPEYTLFAFDFFDFLESRRATKLRKLELLRSGLELDYGKPYFCHVENSILLSACHDIGAEYLCIYD
ncbi:hypothetical protein AX17_004546 [Amanita inopinata Kibby_2008]|nr:hypothetical protein AX17_004546 [Amanita inopinata Kibby_2008]